MDKKKMSSSRNSKGFGLNIVIDLHRTPKLCRAALCQERSLKFSSETLKSLTKQQNLLATEPVLLFRVRENQNYPL